MPRFKSRHKFFIFSSIFLIVIAVVAAGFYEMVHNKIIFINDWIVKEDAVRGVDISSYQVDVDMNKLKEQNIKFIYIKATEGSSHVDEYFARNWQNAKEAEMPAGAYHFFSYDSPGRTQAENYIQTIGESLRGNLLPVVDVELYGNHEQSLPIKDKVVAELKSFADAIEEQYNTKPMIYARRDMYDRYLSTDFADYPRWVRDVYKPASIDNGDDWLIWQYKDRGLLEGYSGGEKYIDLDVVNSSKSLDDLIVK